MNFLSKSSVSSITSVVCPLSKVTSRRLLHISNLLLGVDNRFLIGCANDTLVLDDLTPAWLAPDSNFTAAFQARRIVDYVCTIESL